MAVEEDDDEFATEDEKVEVSWVEADVDVGLDVGMEVCSICTDEFERVEEDGAGVAWVEVRVIEEGGGGVEGGGVEGGGVEGGEAGGEEGGGEGMVSAIAGGGLELARGC